MKKVFKKPDINQDNIVAVDVKKENDTYIQFEKLLILVIT